jgi:hypothetical protein
MCHRVACPNDGKPTWWGCGQHIEAALDGVPPSERCTCEHERVPFLPIMQRVKRRSVTAGSSDEPAIKLSAAPGPNGPVVMLAVGPNREDPDGEFCQLLIDIDLPPTLSPGDLPEQASARDGGLTLHLIPPTTVEVPLVRAKGASATDSLDIFGQGASTGTLRREWVCGDTKMTTKMEDVHARLTLPAQPVSGWGFGAGSGIEPTHAAAALVFAWVLYKFFFGAGGAGAAAGAGASAGAAKPKRQ